MTRSMAVWVLAAVVVLACAGVGAGTLEIRGEVVELTTTQSAPISWNAYNFDVFWCDLDDDLMTETLTIAANTLVGPNTDRTIDKNCLSYQTSPAYQQYELYENEGLTVDGNAGYYLEGWMGETYVAINGRADKLCKLMVEFESSSDKMTIATGEAWDLGGGFALTAKNLTCPYETAPYCDSCTLLLSKNGVKLDEQIIYVNTSDEQDRVYIYAPDIDGEEHIPIFSCYVAAVYNGTENDIVQLKYVFLIDNDVLKIATGETYSAMKVMAASSSYILLRNMDPIDLDAGSIEPITSHIRFRTADDDSTIRFYPMVEHSEPGTYEIRGNVVHLDGAQSADLVWDATNFAGFWYSPDDGLETERLRLVAGTLDTTTNDRTIDRNHLSYHTSPVYQEYELHTNEGLTVDSDHPDGDAGYWIEGWMGERYVAVDSKADKLTKLLVEFDRYDVKTLNSDDTWDLGGGFVLKLVGIDDAGNIATLQLFKNGVPLEGSLKCIDTSTGIKQDRIYTYLKDVAGEDNVPIFSCYVDAVFKQGSDRYAQLKYAFLIDDDIGEIQTYTTYGNMEVVTANATHICLENDGTLYLSTNCWVEIMGGMYFEIADDLCAIRFCPFAERTIPHIPETLTVNNSGGADYTSIQAAIDAAGYGDTIMVYNGTYHENVRVNKQLTLIGIGMPVVDGGWGGSAIEVTADQCTIDGFRVIHGYPYGIFLCYSSNNMLSNNTASNNSVNGIHLFSSSNNMLSSNTASNNPYSGIVLYKSNNHNTLENNTANLNNYFGIKLSNSSSNTLKNNTANSNEMYGISLRGSSDDNTLYHNDLIDNGLYNAYDDSTNQWDSGSEGNYYSDYTGNDTNHDGIGDTPYDIPGGESVDRYPLMQPYSPPTTYSVGQGAPDLATKNHFIDAYNRNGGATVLGSPTTEVHRAWGYLVQDFPGASGYAGGIIIYNPYKNYAYYIHGAIWERYYNLGGPRATTDIEFELGPPVSDIEPYIHTLPPEVSSHGTQFRYQNFEGGALDHNIGTGEVFEIHGAIFAKWRELGYADGELGLVTSDEREAALSPIGTDGRVSDFEGGHIHWHRTGGHGGESYETHGAIDAVYCAEGGSGGDLGFPVSDEYVNPSGYPQSDFEGGYITTTDGVAYEVFEYADKTPPTLVIGTPEDGAEAETYRIEVSGVASDESGIYGVRIKVNGETAAELINSNLGAWNTNVILSYGENEIAVTACDNYFNTATETITVYYHPDFTFAQVTDVHIGYDQEVIITQCGYFDWDVAHAAQRESIKRFIETLKDVANQSHPKFMLITGDLVEWTGESFFKDFKQTLDDHIEHEKESGHEVSAYCIPGNHDRRTLSFGNDDLEMYDKYIKDPNGTLMHNYWFYEGDFMFIGLDSGHDWSVVENPLSPEGSGFEDFQYNRLLESDMKDHPKKIIFMHHPVINEGNDKGIDPVLNLCPEKGGNDMCIRAYRCPLINYSINHGVQLVLTGHTHQDMVFDGENKDPISVHTDKRPLFVQTAAAKDGWYRIIDVKNGVTYPRVTSKAEPRSNLLAQTHCPVHLHAYDSQGRHTGLNASGGVETNIPDSFYIGRCNYSDPNETETLLLYNTTEEYRFEIVANLTEEEIQSPEIESFNFTVEQQTDDARTTIAHLSVPLTENTTATLPINPTTTAYTMEIDYDGDGATDETKDPDSIETNYAPTAAIIAPETGSIYDVSKPVEFNGTGRDPEDGILTNFSLVWYSDINGVIGAGERFSTANLSCGAHRITLMVNDSMGLMSTQSMALTITNDWTPGDLNHDGNVTPADAAIALRIAASGAHDDAADVSRDNRVTSLDALMILQAAAAAITL